MWLVREHSRCPTALSAALPIPQTQQGSQESPQVVLAQPSHPLELLYGSWCQASPGHSLLTESCISRLEKPAVLVAVQK